MIKINIEKRRTSKNAEYRKRRTSKNAGWLSVGCNLFCHLHMTLADTLHHKLFHSKRHLDILLPSFWHWKKYPGNWIALIVMKKCLLKSHHPKFNFTQRILEQNCIKTHNKKQKHSTHLDGFTNSPLLGKINGAN